MGPNVGPNKRLIMGPNEESIHEANYGTKKEAKLNENSYISLAFIADNASLAVITGPAFFLKMGFQIR